MTLICYIQSELLTFYKTLIILGFIESYFIYFFIAEICLIGIFLYKIIPSIIYTSMK